MSDIIRPGNEIGIVIFMGLVAIVIVVFEWGMRSMR